MSPVFDVSTDEGRSSGIEAAVSAVRTGQCVVLPTDTVYGIGTDAFSAAGVDSLLAAKGRGRDMPPPVLIGDPSTVDGLATDVPSYARRLMKEFWPGGLTLIFRSQPTLAWDLGDTNGTVGLRMPDGELVLELLKETGPMAVSSANRTGQPTITTITDAGFAFGPAVEVYLDAGTIEGSTPSTILDCTKADPVLLREGAISRERLQEVLGSVELVDGLDQGPSEEELAAAHNPQAPDASEYIPAEHRPEAQGDGDVVPEGTADEDDDTPSLADMHTAQGALADADAPGVPNQDADAEEPDAAPGTAEASETAAAARHDQDAAAGAPEAQSVDAADHEPIPEADISSAVTHEAPVPSDPSEPAADADRPEADGSEVDGAAADEQPASIGSGYDWSSVSDAGDDGSAGPAADAPGEPATEAPDRAESESTTESADDHDTPDQPRSLGSAWGSADH